MLAFETDCWGVHEALKSPKPDFILVDVRGPASFANGHVQGAINIPHGQMTASRMAEFPQDDVRGPLRRAALPVPTKRR
jgi:rhodanese-related sulfurtransferase